MMSEKLLTLQEACRRLGVYPNTLRKWNLIALVSSFAGKLYSLRSHKYEKVVEGVKQLVAE